MALSTPVDHGTGTRFAVTTDITISSFTSATDELLLAFIMVSGNPGGTADSITGHAGTGDDAWVQVGSTQQVQVRFGISVWACHSSGATATLAIANSTAADMSVAIVGITGADVSGTVANSFDDTDLGSAYGSGLTLALSPGTSLTVGGWGSFDNASLTTEGTEINSLSFGGNNLQFASDYDASGDTTPSVTNGNNPRHVGGQVLEVKEAAGGANTLVADSVSYTYTPTAVELKRGLNLVTESVAYVYTPTAVDLDHGRVLVTESVSYSYTPTAITLTFSPVGNFTLTTESVSYTYTATAVELKVGHVLVAESTAYDYSVTAANLILGSVLDTATVPYIYTVTAAGLSSGKTLTTDSVAYTYTTTAVGLLTGRVLSADSVSYTYNVNALTLNASGQVWTVQSDTSTSWTAQTNSSTTWTVQ